MMIAGEASGDMHGANLILEYKKLRVDARFYGIGSSKMRDAGMEILFDSKEIAVVGLFEVLAHFNLIYKALSGIKKIIIQDKPDILVLIDYPDFNLRVASFAKKAGVKVLYYISPQVWAWRQGRVKKMAKIIDKMAVIFPFEEKFYKKENMDVTFVGHPLAGHVRSTISKEEYRKSLNIPDDSKVITILPGSRKSEITLLLDDMLKACQLINESDKSYYFLISCAPTIERDVIVRATSRYNINARIIDGNAYNAIASSDFVITKSGTSTLETAILGVPMIIVYKVSALTYSIGKRFISVPHIGLVNIVAEERVVPELIQNEATPENIARSALLIIGNKALYETTRAKLISVKEKLGASGASKNTAELIKKTLYEK